MQQTTFGERIRFLMDTYGITQKKVANDLHICQNTFNGYVTDAHQPSFDVVLDLANYFHTSCDFLLGYISNEEMAPSTKDEATLIEIYRIMPPNHRNLWIETGKIMCRADIDTEQFPNT